MARGTTPAPSPAAHDQPDTATSTTTSHTATEAAPTPATSPRYASATTTPNTTPASTPHASQTARVNGPAPPDTAIGYRLQTAKRYAGRAGESRAVRRPRRSPPVYRPPR